MSDYNTNDAQNPFDTHFSDKDKVRIKRMKNKLKRPHRNTKENGFKKWQKEQE